jgi:hypothetical protein
MLFKRAGRMALAIVIAAAASINAQEPHAYRLPKDVELMLLGSYDLTRPTPAGVTEIHVTIVDGQPRLRIGDVESRLIAEGVAQESTNGAKSADVYKFTVVGKPGVSLRFRVTAIGVDSVLYVEDFARPPVMLTARPKG